LGWLLGFLVVDADDDTSITHAELKQAFEKWFREWDPAKSGALDREKTGQGFGFHFAAHTNVSGATGEESLHRIRIAITAAFAGPRTARSDQDNSPRGRLQAGTGRERTND
jgi:hypothetical protein